jgi:alpha-glucoside transport system substrate-binding protein
MKKSFLMGVAVAALLAGGASAADLKFAPGEDAKFNWKSYDDFKAANADLKGQS